MTRSFAASALVALALFAALPAHAGSGFDLPRLDFGTSVPAPAPASEATRGCSAPSSPGTGTCTPAGG